ncbi:hypothetical protein MMC14_000715 [Varicellaria rhodocarpa]|nr:hypothetical protein [Varicellaria rhodocarpa]
MVQLALSSKMSRVSFTAISRCQWQSSLSVRQSSSFAELHSELTSRRLPLIYDYLTVKHSFQLRQTLNDFLPLVTLGQYNNLPPSSFKTLPPGHHLVYFQPLTSLSHLLPDGTDPEQSPGEPFNHRMWAGGSIRFRTSRHPIPLHGQRGVALERIVDVVVKGTPGDKKVIVTVERRIKAAYGQGLIRNQAENRHAQQRELHEQSLRKLLQDDKECGLIERRNIIFLQKPIEKAGENGAEMARKILKPPHEPTFSHVITPTAALLFRFSALTFNAHRIHLDKQYCQEIEGHRNLLVHGPLSVVLILETLMRFTEKRTVIEEIEYRNLAPLYADEEMKICGRANGKDWDVWIEGKDGGYAVKGVVRCKEAQESRPKVKGDESGESQEVQVTLPSSVEDLSKGPQGKYV